MLSHRLCVASGTEPLFDLFILETAVSWYDDTYVFRVARRY